MVLQLYPTVLLLATGVNLIICYALLYNSIWFRNYDIYRRSLILMAVNYAIFAVGFLLHAHFQLRLSSPALADALTASYFHSGGVLFGWSHIPLMCPGYLTRRVVVRDLIILAVGVACYWLAATHSTLSMVHGAMGIFFVHASFIAYTFYHIYFKTQHSIEQMPAEGSVPKWWTPDTKRTVLGHYHAFVIGCHLIIVFGLGSVALTAAFPSSIWPYIVLSLVGSAVFSYLFYSILEYGSVIDSATCASEYAADKKQTLQSKGQKEAPQKKSGSRCFF